MTEKQLIEWLLNEISRASADSHMATEQDWVSYHQGELDAFTTVAALLGALA